MSIGTTSEDDLPQQGNISVTVERLHDVTRVACHGVRFEDSLWRKGDIVLFG